MNAENGGPREIVVRRVELPRRPGSKAAPRYWGIYVNGAYWGVERRPLDVVEPLWRARAKKAGKAFTVDREIRKIDPRNGVY